MPMIPRPNALAGAQMAPVPDFTTAQALDDKLALEAYQQRMENLGGITKGIGQTYKGYVDLTDHNPLADLVGKWRGGKTDAPIGPEPPMGNYPPNVTPRQGPPIGPRPSNLGPAPGAGPQAAVGLEPSRQMIGQLNDAGQYASVTPGGAQALGGIPEGAEVVSDLSNAADMASKGASLGSKVAGPAGAALSIALRSQEPGMTDEYAIGKGMGNVAGAALPWTAAPLLAAGPIGWAGLAAQGLASLYGMLG